MLNDDRTVFRTVWFRRERRRETQFKHYRCVFEWLRRNS